MNELYDEDQVYSELYAYMIWSTKNQDPSLGLSWRKHLRNYISELILDCECHLITSRIAPDHLHLLVKFHPDAAMNDLLITIKSATAIWIRTNIPGQEHFEWQKADCTFTVSSEKVSGLIKEFNKPDQTSYVDEIYPLLKAEGFEYDPLEILK
jgi:REP element-mobilizing transposase RayT